MFVSPPYARGWIVTPLSDVDLCLRALQYALGLSEPPTLDACREWIEDYEKRREACTGVSASWCPRCGDCACPRFAGERQEEDPCCPLHGRDSNHGELQ